MNYRLNTYNKKYIMVNFNELAALSDTEQISSEMYNIIYNIHLELIKLLTDSNRQIQTYDIALHKKNPFSKHLTKREHIKSESDEYIYLYENNELKEIDLSSRVKTRKRTK